MRTMVLGRAIQVQDLLTVWKDRELGLATEDQWMRGASGSWAGFRVPLELFDQHRARELLLRLNQRADRGSGLFDFALGMLPLAIVQCLVKGLGTSEAMQYLRSS
jgi:hypothetical protein